MGVVVLWCLLSLRKFIDVYFWLTKTTGTQEMMGDVGIYILNTWKQKSYKTVEDVLCFEQISFDRLPKHITK